MKELFNKVVGMVGSSTTTYSSKSPFHPDKNYPEIQSFSKKKDSSNNVYGMIRELFHTMGLDKKNYGKTIWNPLKDVITPGSTVCLKPNFVMHYNWKGDTVFAVITHGSIIRAVADYALIALKGKGKIIIGDAPQADADFKKLTEVTGMKKVIDHLRSVSSIPIEYIDFRKKKDIIHEGVCIREKTINGDPKGYATINLGKDSLLSKKDGLLFYGSDYNREKTIKHHSNGRHEYVVSRSVLSADVIISLPKLKTHKKAGVTLNLKNVIGINGDKNFIPHYSIGDTRKGGDEFPIQGNGYDHWRYSITRKSIDFLLGKMGWILALPVSYGVKAYKIFKTRNTSIVSRKEGFSIADLFWKSFLKKDCRAGNWHGNDTVWRCTLDLTRILLYANKEGTMKNTQQRRFFSVIDGIIAGEREGPLAPTAKSCGIIIGGFNPVLVDAVGAAQMGFDPEDIPTIYEALHLKTRPLLHILREKKLMDTIIFKTSGMKKRKISLHPSKGWLIKHRRK